MARMALRIAFGVAVSLAVLSTPADARRRFHRIDIADALATQATSVNGGYVVGYYVDSGGNPQAYWKAFAGKPHRLRIRGASTSLATGLAISPTLGPLVAGSYTDGKGQFHAFRLTLQTGQIDKFSDGKHDTKAAAINQDGDLTGVSQRIIDKLTAYYTRSDILKKFDVPDATKGADPKSINARGDIAGVYLDDIGNQGFWRDRNGKLAEFHCDDLAQTSPLAINDKTVIAGWCGDNAISTHGMLRTPDGLITVFDYPGAKSTQLDSINNSGVSVGTYMDADNISHGFIREKNGTLKTLDVPGGSQTFPLSIDDDGDVAGIVFDSDGEHGFEWVPQ